MRYYPYSRLSFVLGLSRSGAGKTRNVGPRIHRWIYGNPRGRLILREHRYRKGAGTPGTAGPRGWWRPADPGSYRAPLHPSADRAPGRGIHAVPGFPHPCCCPLSAPLPGLTGPLLAPPVFPLPSSGAGLSYLQDQAWLMPLTVKGGLPILPVSWLRGVWRRGLGWASGYAEWATAVSSADTSGAPLPSPPHGVWWNQLLSWLGRKTTNSLDHVSPGCTWEVEVCFPGVISHSL